VEFFVSEKRESIIISDIYSALTELPSAPTLVNGKESPQKKKTPTTKPSQNVNLKGLTIDVELDKEELSTLLLILYESQPSPGPLSALTFPSMGVLLLSHAMEKLFVVAFKRMLIVSIFVVSHK
jgi:hypothetical protein